MSCSCGLGSLPRSNHRSSYAPLSQAMPVSTTCETNCSTAPERLRTSSTLIGDSALLWEQVPHWPGGLCAGRSGQRHQSWLARSGSLSTTANWGAAADSGGAQIQQFTAQAGLSALAPLGLRRQFGTSPAIASSTTPGSSGSGVADSSLSTTASASLRGPDEQRLLSPLAVVERRPRVCRQDEPRSAGLNNNNEDCWPLLAISLALCAVSLLLLAIGGLFLGVHLRQRARSVLPSSSATSASAAAAAAAAAAESASTSAPLLLTPSFEATLASIPTPRTVVHSNSKYDEDGLDDVIGPRMRSLVDNRVKPCDNFHGYACGRLAEYLAGAADFENFGRLHRRPSDLLELAGVRLLSELAVAMETGAASPSLQAAYRRCRISGAAGACLRSLHWAAPEAAKALTRSRELNVTALHMALSDLFAGVVSELRDLVSVSPALTAHTRRWMDSRLSGLYLYVDSVGNAGAASASTSASISFAISGLGGGDIGDRCRTDTCQPSSPDWSFGSACICLSNATGADVAVPLAAIRPELYAPSLSPSLAHAFMGASLAEAAFAAVGPAHRRRFYSTESETRASAAVGCLSRRLRLPSGGQLLTRSVSRLAGLRVALSAFLRHIQHEQRPRELAAFFLNWAQTQCSLTDPASAAFINWAVVEASALAFSAFSRAFNCSAGDAMMPAAPVRDDNQELCRFP